MVMITMDFVGQEVHPTWTLQIPLCENGGLIALRSATIKAPLLFCIPHWLQLQNHL